MSEPRICSDTDLIELCSDLDLWLKPHSKLTITVTLPTLKCESNSGQCISTWQVMDKLKNRTKPNKFKSLKVVKSSIDLIRFEAECDSQITLNAIESRLDRVTLKLPGFAEQLFVKTEKVKIGNKLSSSK